ncbi:MAG: hypothetical protein AAB522_01565 [Patescibacteria group bacterium]
MNIKISFESLAKTLIGLGILILLAYTYFFLYFKIQSLSADIGSANRSVAVINKKAKEFEVVKSNLESQNKNIATLESAFFSEDDFVDLLNTFENLGKKVGARFEAKGANLSKSGEPAEISFTLKGGFISITKFLTLLENSRYFGIINKFSLFESGESSKTLVADVEYLIFNYESKSN